MVVDTSALIAILLGEPERDRFIQLLTEADDVLISAATLVEASIVMLAKTGPEGVRDLDDLLTAAAIRPVAVDDAQAHLARDGFQRYGKGHASVGLTFGDCFSYALATSCTARCCSKTTTSAGPTSRVQSSDPPQRSGRGLSSSLLGDSNARGGGWMPDADDPDAADAIVPPAPADGRTRSSTGCALRARRGSRRYARAARGTRRAGLSLPLTHFLARLTGRCRFDIQSAGGAESDRFA
ncbi:MAG: type II toxin-antitoxin system VapC family toxin [Solirubrobacteraceae bacterium]